MKKLKDVGYIREGMILIQNNVEYEITTIMDIGMLGTFVHVNNDRSVAIPFGKPLRDDIYVKEVGNEL